MTVRGGEQLTLQELNRYFELQARLKQAKEMLSSLREAAHPGGQVLTGMPHAPGVKDKVGDLAIEIADLSERISYMEAEIAEKQSELSRFIDSIKEDHLRMIFRLRFLRGLAWKDVAAVVGGHNTEYGVKAACYRYLAGMENLSRDVTP